MGDRVLARDPQTGEHGARTVTKVWVHQDDLAALATSAGFVTTTHDHPFWNDTDRQWQDAEDLGAGDRLLTDDGSQIGVVGLSAATTVGTAYNLTVDDIHTYFVRIGDEAVLVHNTGAGRSSKGRAAVSVI